jgi:hypothetical protein
MNSLQESAWLAGLIEGEGAICAEKKSDNRRHYLRVSLEMTDKDVIEHAGEVMHTKSAIESREPRGENYKPSWRIRWSGVQAENLIRRIDPYMGQRRKAKIKECLEMNLSHHANN